MPIFDTHCHLGFYDDGDPVAEHARAVTAGVTAMITVAIDADTAERCREHASLPGVRWSAGLHPNDATRFAADWPRIDALARTPGCAAIGETGLDCYRDRTPLDQQQASLRAHLALARELGLPVILHCRDAFEPLFETLRAEPPTRGVMHCFSGTEAEARIALDLGFYVSFAGPLTYKKNDALRAAAAFVPDDRVLVETDAPFLPPQPYRGKRNEPAYLVHTVAALAAVRGIGTDEAAELTWQNAVRLFG
ncbi:MAG: TatD family hydrolase [Planctomycetes bacterium]|nr:TatD family hydrolase [Planctomycetota bacterium]